VYLSLNELTNNENAKDIIHYYNLDEKHVSAYSELLNDIKTKKATSNEVAFFL